MIEVDFEDLDTMARTMWGECRGCDTEGQIGVANVINNRVNARRWYGKTHKEVCLKEWQFSCWNEGCLLYTSPSPRDTEVSRMPSSA